MSEAYQVTMIHGVNPRGPRDPARHVEGLYESEAAAMKAIVDYLTDEWKHAFPQRTDGERAILSAMSGSGVTVVKPQPWDMPEFRIERIAVRS